jgi:hypothetical protein
MHNICVSCAVLRSTSRSYRPTVMSYRARAIVLQRRAVFGPPFFVVSFVLVPSDVSRPDPIVG